MVPTTLAPEGTHTRNIVKHVVGRLERKRVIVSVLKAEMAMHVADTQSSEPRLSMRVAGDASHDVHEAPVRGFLPRVSLF